MEENDLKIWDDVAEEYDRLNGKEGDIFRKNIIIPTVLELLEDIKGKHILDAGCGNGCITKKLYEASGIVKAIDGSEKLIELARRNFPEIGFAVHNLNEKTDFQNEYFDAVLCSMVLGDLENPNLCLGEFYRILKDGGKLVVVIPHPCFTYPIGKLRKGFWRRLLRQDAVMHITNYDRERMVQIPLHGMSSATKRYHRKLQTYCDLFNKNGFTIKNIKEPVIGGEKDVENIPFIMAFELEKNAK